MRLQEYFYLMGYVFLIPALVLLLFEELVIGLIFNFVALGCFIFSFIPWRD